MLECEEIVDQFFGGVRCTYSGAVGTVSFTCSYDGGPPQECETRLTKGIALKISSIVP